MIQELITILVGAGLVIKFYGTDGGTVGVSIFAPEIEYPRGGAIATSPEKALAIAAARGLSQIYHRARSGIISLDEGGGLDGQQNK